MTVKTKTIVAVCMLVVGSVVIQSPAEAVRGSGGPTRPTSILSTAYLKDEGGREVQPVRYVFYGENCLAWSLKAEIADGSKLVFDPLELDNTPDGASRSAAALCSTEDTFRTCESSNGLQIDRIKRDGSIVRAEGVRSRQPVRTPLASVNPDLQCADGCADVFTIDFNDTEALALAEPSTGFEQLIALNSEGSIQLSDTLTGGDKVVIVNPDVRLKLSSDYTQDELDVNTATIKFEAFLDGPEPVGESEELPVVCLQEFKLVDVLQPAGEFADLQTLEGVDDLIIKVMRTNAGPSTAGLPDTVEDDTVEDDRPGAITAELTESTAGGFRVRDLELGGPIAPARVDLLLDAAPY